MKKQITLSKEVHNLVKGYCLMNGIQMYTLVNFSLKKAIEHYKKNGYKIDAIDVEIDEEDEIAQI